MNNIELQATTRTGTGNGPARALRREGRVPAILYGPADKPQMLSVGTHDFEEVVKEGNVGRSIFNLVIDGGKETKAAMIKELQIHPVHHGLIHVDFYAVDMARKVRVNVPVTATGKSKGVEMGGMLQIIRRELEVLCLPNAIPQEITIDITELDVGQSVHVEDIQLGGDVELPHEVNFTVLTILSQKKAEVEEVEEGEEVAEAAEEEAATGEE
ncbi:MAG: 50S ribosomal protein L25/general stress protein Ctc [Desulfobacteraceae bacterium]